MHGTWSKLRGSLDGRGVLGACMCVSAIPSTKQKVKKKEQYVSLSLGNISLYKQIKEQRHEEERRVMWEKQAKSE